MGRRPARFLTGFTAGYYGGTGTSPNGAAHGANINLSSNSNWDPTYLFGNNTTNVFGSNAGYDKYAAVFNTTAIPTARATRTT